MELNTTLSIMQLAMLIAGMCTFLFGIGVWIFKEWFRNQTTKFVTKDEFELLKNNVGKVEREMEMGFLKSVHNQTSLMDKLTSSHDYMSRELKHLTDGIKQTNANNTINMKALCDFIDRHEKS